jgi:hypothetical protein
MMRMTRISTNSSWRGKKEVVHGSGVEMEREE